ncbi:MAG TPA: hypothetical protein VIR77_02715, partial [Pontiella sp.]
MKQAILFILLFLLPLLSVARHWTNSAGRTVDAEVVWIYPDRTVALKTESGKTVKLPFNTFSEEDQQYLEHLLIRKLSGRGMPHPVSWKEMNRLFGLEIWQDDLLWDDSTDGAATRIKLSRESKTEFLENYRSYPLGE